MNPITPESPIIGIDPGTLESAYVVWDPLAKSILEKGILLHTSMLAWLRAQPTAYLLVLEMMQSYGRPVGKDVFDTVKWLGRYQEAWECKGRPTREILRVHIKTHHCKDSKAKDSWIRQALIDKYGPVGTKKFPGPLYGVVEDEWQALAIATMVAETTPRGQSAV